MTIVLIFKELEKIPYMLVETFKILKGTKSNLRDGNCNVHSEKYTVKYRLFQSHKLKIFLDIQ